MGKGIHGGVDNHGMRSAHQIFSVNQGELREDLMGNGDLRVLRMNRQDGYTGDFRTGSACGGNRDHIQCVCGQRRVIKIIGIVRVSVNHEGDGLGRIQRGASADADHKIGLFRNAES